MAAQQLDEHTLRALVDAGLVREALITRVRQPDGHKWAIRIKFGMKEQVLRSRREPIRRFNTLDTASKLLYASGLHRMTVDYA